jgi:hypothetical protein
MAALWHRSPSTVATGRLTLDTMTRYVELASSEVLGHRGRILGGAPGARAAGVRTSCSFLSVLPRATIACCEHDLGGAAACAQ